MLHDEEEFLIALHSTMCYDDCRLACMHWCYKAILVIILCSTLAHNLSWLCNNFALMLSLLENYLGFKLSRGVGTWDTVPCNSDIIHNKISILMESAKCWIFPDSIIYKLSIYYNCICVNEPVVLNFCFLRPCIWPYIYYSSHDHSQTAVHSHFWHFAINSLAYCWFRSALDAFLIKECESSLLPHNYTPLHGYLRGLLWRNLRILTPHVVWELITPAFGKETTKAGVTLNGKRDKSWCDIIGTTF